MNSSANVSGTSNPRKRRKVEGATGPNENAETTTVEEPHNEGQKSVAHEKRRRGHKLAALVGMPLDILFETLGHLNPYDLVKLSRTNRDFRNLLLSRSSISVWKASLQSVPGLPECPPGMSEPAWANLVYSPHCHICLAPGVRNVEWRFRTRMCSKCAKDELSDLCGDEIYEVMKMYGRSLAGIPQPEDLILNSNPLILRKICPSRRTRGAVFFLTSELTRIRQEYEALDNDVSRREYIRSREKVVQDIEEHAERSEEWAANQVKTREEELDQLREERYSAIVNKLEELGWGKDVESIRYPDSLRRQKPVNKPQRLTARIWSNIKDDVIAYMHKIREKRLKREFEGLVAERKRVAIEFFRQYTNSKLLLDEIMPGPPDYCAFDPIKEILNLPVGVEVVIDNFVRVIPLLPALLTEWRRTVDKLLLEPIRAAKRQAAWRAEMYDAHGFNSYEESCVPRPKPMEFTDDEIMGELKLATSVFSCSTCAPRGSYDDYDYFDFSSFGIFNSSLHTNLTSTVLFYPQVIAHRCFHATSRHSDFDIVSPDHNYSLSNWEVRTPWNGRLLKLEQSSSANAAKIVELSGLDPKVVTSEEMDSLDLRFACRSCPRDPQTGESVGDRINIEGDTIPEDCVVPLFSWRAAVRHLKDVKHTISYIKFTREELGEEIMTAEDEHKLECGAMWLCVKCRDLPTEKLEPSSMHDMLNIHYANRHDDITEPLVLGEHYYKAASAPDKLASAPPFFVYSKAGKLAPFKLPEMEQDGVDPSDSKKIYNKFRYAA